MPRVIVDQDRCTGCGTCHKVCPSRVFAIRRGKSCPVNEENCVMCRACITHCPTEAITIMHRDEEAPFARLYGG